MSQPNIDIVNINKTKISDEETMDQCTFQFICDEDIDDFDVRADGDRLTGIVVERASHLYCSDNIVCNSSLSCFEYMTLAGTPVDVIIDWNELTRGDMEYQINVYVKVKGGAWSE